jgi:ATP-dependent metalloprotease FtsH
VAIVQPEAVPTESGWRHRLEALQERYTSWKRGRAARGRSGPGKMVIGLVASLVVLLAIAGLTLSALFASPGGTTVTLGDVAQLASGDRIEKATLLDQDDVVVLKLRSVDEAKALQQAEAGVPFFSVAGAEFVESLVGVGAARIRDLFKRVNAVAPANVFIDELDAAGRKRGSGGGGGGTDEREQTLNQLLVEMDGFDVSTGVVVIAATNRPDILDPALMRPGRFDRHITVERPDAEGRERILAIHAHKKPLAPDVDLARLADRCPGFTGADLASVVNEAALLTIRQQGSMIHQKELEEAVVRVLEGPQRRGRVLLPEERQRAAYHEIGHVVVAATLGRHEDIHRVTVLSRGRNIAAATFGDSEATLLTRSSLHNQLVATLGGIAAEELALGEGSTGAEQDLEHATDLARDMVTRYGMSDVVGPVRLQVKAGEGFLGNDTELVELSDQTQREVEGAIRSLVEQALAPLMKKITEPAPAAARRTAAPRRTTGANGRAKAGASRAKG